MEIAGEEDESNQGNTDHVWNSCKQVVGSFRKDVADSSQVTSDDVEMDGDFSIPSYDDRGRKWSCVECKVPVAELTGLPTQWRVHTARGWLA